MTNEEPLKNEDLENEDPLENEDLENEDSLENENLLEILSVRRKIEGTINA